MNVSICSCHHDTRNKIASRLVTNKKSPFKGFFAKMGNKLSCSCGPLKIKGYRWWWQWHQKLIWCWLSWRSLIIMINGHHGYNHSGLMTLGPPTPEQGGTDIYSGRKMSDFWVNVSQWCSWEGLCFFSGKEKLPINDDDDVGVNVTLCCKEEPNNHGWQGLGG